VGYPASEDKRSETVTRILAAAMNIFAEVGFGSTRVDEIAKRAGVNKATIYYHIGNKETLYAEVIHDVIGNMADMIALGIKEAQSPEEKLRTYIRNITRSIDRNPLIPPIMMREVASGGQHFPNVVAQDMARIIGILTGILDEGIKQGIFIKTTPFILHMMVIGTVMFYKTSGPIRARLDWIPESVKHLSADLTGEVAEEIENLILRAIKGSS